MFTGAALKRSFTTAFDRTLRSAGRAHRSGKRFASSLSINTVGLNQSRKKARRAYVSADALNEVLDISPEPSPSSSDFTTSEESVKTEEDLITNEINLLEFDIVKVETLKEEAIIKDEAVVNAFLAEALDHSPRLPGRGWGSPSRSPTPILGISTSSSSDSDVVPETPEDREYAFFRNYTDYPSPVRDSFLDPFNQHFGDFITGNEEAFPEDARPDSLAIDPYTVVTPDITFNNHSFSLTPDVILENAFTVPSFPSLNNPTPSTPLHGHHRFVDGQIISRPFHDSFNDKNPFVGWEHDCPQVPTRSGAPYVYRDEQDFLLARSQPSFDTEIGWAEKAVEYFSSQIHWATEARTKLIDDYQKQQDVALSFNEDADCLHGFRFQLFFVEDCLRRATYLHQANLEVLHRKYIAENLEHEGNLSAANLKQDVAEVVRNTGSFSLPLIYNVL